MESGLYDDGFIINYDEGDRSLQRIPVKHVEDINDKLYTIKQDDRLTQIAFNFYKDPLKWFIIADVNNIDNPFDLELGKEIIIPNIDRYTR